MNGGCGPQGGKQSVPPDQSGSCRNGCPTDIPNDASRDADKEAAIITVRHGKLTFVETIRP
jgi:hypothetical protein